LFLAGKGTPRVSPAIRGRESNNRMIRNITRTSPKDSSQTSVELMDGSMLFCDQ
jgi:hypothetical protein